MPDLSVTKTADQTTAVVGDTVTYTLTVAELEDCPAANILLTDTFDSSTSASLASTVDSSNFGTCDGTGFPIITCDLDTQAAVTTTITYTVSIDGGAGTTLNNTADVTSDAASETDDTNNTADFALQILAPTPSPTPVPTPPPPPPPPPLIPDAVLHGDGCSQLSAGGQVSSFLGYGLSALVLALFGVRRLKLRK